MTMYALDFKEDSKFTAQLVFDKDIMQKLTSLAPSVIDITPRFAPERLRVENFIRSIYRQSYNADITVTYPTLMSVRNTDGSILAAVGFRPARDELLFLEQYTQEPIEAVMTRLYGTSIGRAEIAEIGNLASSGSGTSIFLFAAIASYLLNLGIPYATVTGTDRLHKRFKSMGLNPHVVCDASLKKLNTEQKNWGSYYNTQPRVLAGSLEDSMRQLNTRLGAEYQENGITLFPRLHHKSTAKCP